MGHVEPGPGPDGPKERFVDDALQVGGKLIDARQGEVAGSPLAIRALISCPRSYRSSSVVKTVPPGVCPGVRPGVRPGVCPSLACYDLFSEPSHSVQGLVQVGGADVEDGVGDAHVGVGLNVL